MRTICTTLLIVLLVLLSACSPPQRVKTSINPKITPKIELKEELQKITSEEIYNQLILNLDTSKTTWSISLCLFKKGADEDFIEYIYEKIYSKVDSYKQKVEPSEITTKSYAKYIRNTINKEVAKANL